jgi:hypothetical protein
LERQRDPKRKKRIHDSEPVGSLLAFDVWLTTVELLLSTKTIYLDVEAWNAMLTIDVRRRYTILVYI